MRGIRILIMLLVAAAPAYSTAIRVDSETEFLSAIETPYLFEDFNEYLYGSYKAPSLTVAQYDYQVVLSAQNTLYSLAGSMSTKRYNDLLVIDFSDSPEPITAVGGYFWPTDKYGHNMAGYTKVVLSDGSVYEIESSQYGAFLGLIATDDTVFERLEVSVMGSLSNPYYWPTVDNLYAGTAQLLIGGDDNPIPNPEPSSMILLASGLFGICVMVFRKK